MDETALVSSSVEGIPPAPLTPVPIVEPAPSSTVKFGFMFWLDLVPSNFSDYDTFLAHPSLDFGGAVSGEGCVAVRVMRQPSSPAAIARRIAKSMP